jgi:glycosyltransferase involved in cell wall biosynthesis
MKIGIVNTETWGFFDEVFRELREHHQVAQFKVRQNIESPIFKERINRTLFDLRLQNFMRANDLVFFEWASGLLAAATHLPKTTPIVTRLHRYEMYYWADRINWDNVDRVILVSEAKRREFARRFPAQANKLVAIPESISLDRFNGHIKPYAGDLGILCHLTPRKRVYELILAFAGTGLASEGFHLHIGGGPHERFGDYYQALLDVVKKLGLEKQVTFYGNFQDPLEFYPKIDVFISNSYSEGLQVSPMEAVASGCYCFSHAWDGADELLPAENLYLTDQEMAAAIRRYAALSDAERRRETETLQASIRERFDSRKISAEIRGVIEETYTKVISQ